MVTKLRACGSVLVLCLSLLGAGHALGAAGPVVHVVGERIALGDVVGGMPEPWGSVDLGSAPLPLQGRTLSAKQIEARLSRARIGPPPLPLPERVLVRRAGQSLSEPQLRTLLQGAVAEVLAADVTLKALVLSGGLVLPEGDIECAVPDLSRVRKGRQSILASVRVRSGDGTVSEVRVPVLLDLEVPERSRLQVVQRGQKVSVVLYSGQVRVQSSATAQQGGAIGDTISVTPTQGSHMLQARVVDGRTVEVEL